CDAAHCDIGTARQLHRRFQRRYDKYTYRRADHVVRQRFDLDGWTTVEESWGTHHGKHHRQGDTRAVTLRSATGGIRFVTMWLRVARHHAILGTVCQKPGGSVMSK